MSQGTVASDGPVKVLTEGQSTSDGQEKLTTDSKPPTVQNRREQKTKGKKETIETPETQGRSESSVSSGFVSCVLSKCPV